MSSPLGLSNFENDSYKIKSGTVGQQKTSQRIKSIFSDSFFSPFPKTVTLQTGNVELISKRKDIHNDEHYDLSIDAIVKYTENKPAMRLKYADFAYLKNVGVYPNNRMIVARRFPGPVGNDLTAIKSRPLATLISWIKDSDESFINVTFNEKYVDAEASYTAILNELGEDIRLSKKQGTNLGDLAAAGFNAIPFPGLTEPLQRAVLKKFGLVTGDAYNLPLGNPNLIREAKRRFTVSKDQAESGLGTTIEVKMEVEYEQKFLGGLDPTLVYLDIIQNAITFGTSDAAFQMGGAFGGGIGEALSALTSGSFAKIFSLLKEIVSTILNEVKQLAVKIANALITPPGKGELTKEGIINFITEFTSPAAKALGAVVGKYKVRLMGITNALTGSPSTPWHICIGNPRKPIFSSGDMLCKSVSLDLGPVLAFNDLPSTVKITVQFENARPLGAQEIFNRLNTGKGRSYTRITYQGSKKDPKGTEEERDLKPRTKSFDDSTDNENEIDTIYAGIGEIPDPDSDWIARTQNNITANSGTPNAAITGLEPQTTASLPGTINEIPSTFPSPTELPIANSDLLPPAPVNPAPPAQPTNFGTSPLTGDGLKNASNRDLSNRLGGINSETNQLTKSYQSVSFPASNETPEQSNERNRKKDEIESQMTKLYNEKKGIQKEQRSRI